jgi:hypothetical protein
MEINACPYLMKGAIKEQLRIYGTGLCLEHEFT